ncbi:MAG: hypothetical protein QXX68_01025 [Candidatus Pacearchaeota archaeon]
MSKNKKGAEESNVIIFIILALVVAGTVVFFSWKFFSTAGNLVDASDPTVTVAVESCRLEIQRQQASYCNSEKKVNLKAGGEMIVSCHYIDEFIKKGAVSEGLEISQNAKDCGDETDFKKRVCSRVNSTSYNQEKSLKETFVNGERCDRILTS